MAAGEYVSVSTQRDTERALIAKETRELAEEPEEELAELAELYRQKGLSDELARQVAVELTEHDALRAHLDIELGIDPDELTSPWQAAWASMLAFTLGALLPLLTILLFSPDLRAVVHPGRGRSSPSPAPGSSAPGSARHRRVPPCVSASWSAALLAMAVTYGDRHAASAPASPDRDGPWSRPAAVRRSSQMSGRRTSMSTRFAS